MLLAVAYDNTKVKDKSVDSEVNFIDGAGTLNTIGDKMR